MIDRVQVINNIIQEWGEEFVTDLQTRARERIKSEGVEDMDISIIRATASSAAIVMLDFGAYLRFYDMRKVQRDSMLGPQGIERIKKWVQKKGIQNFLSGYKYPTTVTKGGIERPVPVNRILNNIAWGISVKKKRLKRKKWYNKQKGSDVYKLYFSLIDAIITHSLKEHKQSVLDNQSLPF